jgi:hypothetical protein
MLGEINGVPHTVVLDLKTEHPVKFTKVSDFHMLAQTILEVVDELDSCGGHGAVIYMHGNDGKLVLVLVLLKEHGLVNFALAEVKGQKDGPQLLVPALARLLKTIQSLHKV